MRTIILAAALFVVAAAPAHAQQPAAEPATARPAQQFTVQVDNDYFAANADYHYTNGLRFSSTPARPWPIVRYIADLLLVPPTALVGAPAPAAGKSEPQRTITYVAGQNLFTPDKITERGLIVRDRPYAGWLYVGFALHRVGGDTLDTVELDVGVVGPSALGRQTQIAWHEQVNIGLPQGWDNQLHDEPAVLVTFERRHRYGPLVANAGYGLKLDSSPATAHPPATST